MMFTPGDELELDLIDMYGDRLVAGGYIVSAYEDGMLRVIRGDTVEIWNVRSPGFVSATVTRAAASGAQAEPTEELRNWVAGLSTEELVARLEELKE